MNRYVFFSRKRMVGMVLAVLPLVFTVAALTGCKKSPASAARELAEKLNKKNLGVEFRATAEQTEAAELSDGFRITFKNPEFRINTAIYKDTFMDAMFKPGAIPVKIGAAVFLYKPKSNELFLEKMENTELELNETHLQPPTGAPDAIGKLSVQCGAVVCENLNISPLLNDNGAAPMELLTALMTRMGAYSATMENLRYALEIPEKTGPVMTMEFTLPRATIRQKQFSELLAAIYLKDKPLPDFSAPLKEKKGLFDIDMTMENMVMKVSKGPDFSVNVKMSRAGVGYSLLPNGEGSHYNFLSRFTVDDLAVEAPNLGALSWISLLARLNKLDYSLALEHLSANFIKSYGELIRLSMNMPKMANSEEAIKQKEMQIGLYGMTLASEFVSSSAVLKLDVDPLDTPFGKAGAHVTFSMPAANTPAGKAEAVIYDLAGVMEMLRTSSGLPPETLKELEKSVHSLFIPDSQGHGRLTFEVKKEEPGIYYLNGKAKK